MSADKAIKRCWNLECLTTTANLEATVCVNCGNSFDYRSPELEKLIIEAYQRGYIDRENIMLNISMLTKKIDEVTQSIPDIEKKVEALNETIALLQREDS